MGQNKGHKEQEVHKCGTIHEAIALVFTGEKIEISPEHFEEFKRELSKAIIEATPLSIIRMAVCYFDNLPFAEEIIISAYLNLQSDEQSLGKAIISDLDGDNRLKITNRIRSLES